MMVQRHPSYHRSFHRAETLLDRLLLRLLIRSRSPCLMERVQFFELMVVTSILMVQEEQTENLDDVAMSLPR